MEENTTAVNNAAIFDMDGLLLDTEPLWGESMLAIAGHYQIPVTLQQFRHTTGLRIFEVTRFWQEKFPWPGNVDADTIANDILDDIIARSKEKGRVMPGVVECLHWLRAQGVLIGLATSSPMRMVDALIGHFNLSDFFDVMHSADAANFGKPHPEVYLQCAEALHIAPYNSVAFEDSLNGVIAGKAARMKVVAVPEAAKLTDPRFAIADLKLASLAEFTPQMWSDLMVL
jgi:HAD superfamily hydrolase (TIGR01509 family)